MRPILLILSALVIALAAPSASRADSTSDGFHHFLETDIWPAAKARGVPRPVFNAAFGGVKPDLSLPDLVLPGETAKVEENNFQAEFKSGADYLSDRAIAANAATGKALLQRYGAVLKRIEARYGVPAPIVVAIWGRESNFGRAKIPQNAFQVLGTKAWLSRRKEMFRTELLAALQIVADGHLKASQLKSSWAGALGQPQFMPSKFLQYAVDFDGDGRKDIWNSVPDTLASIANFLHQAGWQRGRGWGFEALVPKTLSCTGEGPDRGETLAGFARDGVRRPSGAGLPHDAENRQDHLLMPAGRFGPAFVVTDNFYVIKAYNNSDLYALFVGLVADRMTGGAPLKGSFSPTDRMTRGDVARMQEKLEGRGYDVGGVDGLAGFKTRRSIGAAEKALGLPQTCWPTKALAARL
ncbi:lytic murein transglycosylase [Jiella sp. M17.18]|uniref:lytic murein transglycosylase n=1 Tax=Jiella sp. M17.18 TaxID=3234247 RepID=UPI0034DFC304